jgi:hypothetical protein
MAVGTLIESTSQHIHQQFNQGVDAFTAGTQRVARGTVAGMLGGLVAAWMMNQYQAIESRPVNVRKEELRRSYAKPKRAGKTAKTAATKAASSAGDEPTVKAAETVSRQLFDHELTPSEKQIAGPTVHYGYGALVGGLYGGLSELMPSVGMGIGIPYATLLWLLGSETAVPALGLAKSPTQVPIEKHATAMATHFVYGLTLDICRRIFRLLL